MFTVLRRTLLFVGVLTLASCSAARISPGAVQDAPPDQRSPDAESIGSTRNSRVAISVAGRTAPLIYLTGVMPEDELEQLSKSAPNVKIISGLTRQTALNHAGEAHAADARVFSIELLEKAPNLVWVQALSAGVDRYMAMQPLVDNDAIVLTNMRAVHGPAIADHAMAMLLQITRNLRFYDRQQAIGNWSDGDTPWPSSSLTDRTMLVVGLGGIGTEIAQRASGFGMNVIATRRSEAPSPEFVQKVGQPSDLMTMLPDADVVAVCVPLTAETEGLFDEAAFTAMKRGAILINIARGKIVDTDAMMAALNDGRLAGACLDVTDPEPLPPDHPLWKMPTVVITPHVAADADITDTRRVILMRENIQRFGAGEPLLNVVDKKAGY
jgi:phosphoglycerate dehydrogenase-like enzyme